MSKFEFLYELLKMVFTRKLPDEKITIYQTTKIKIMTEEELPIHADARIYGKTPVEFSIVPSALNVIIGFADPEDDPTLVQKEFIQA